MADKEKNEDIKVVEKDAKKSGSMILWILVFVMAAAGAGGGFFLASTVAQKPAQKPEAESKKTPEQEMQDLIQENSQEVYYHELSPVVACLDEPSLSRYVRATIILEMEAGFDPVAGAEFLKQKEPLLSNWLTKYLAGLTLIQVQGSRNLDRIQLEIYEEFNNILFPNKKPMVEKVLFKEFVVS